MSMGRISSNGSEGTDRPAVQRVQAAHGGSGGRSPVHRSRSHGRPRHPCGGVGAGSRGPSAEAHHPHQTSIQAARRQDMGHLRARQGAGGAQTAARRPRWELRRARCQCPGFRTARHRQDPRHVRHRPPLGRVGPLGPVHPCLPAGPRHAGGQAGPRSPTHAPQARQLRLPAHRRPRLPTPREPRSPRSCSPSSPSGTNAALWASPRISSSLSGTKSSRTLWPLQLPLTGSSTTRSSWSSTSPAIGPVAAQQRLQQEVNRQK